MRLTNLGIVIKDDKILLAMKKRGFGAGLYNSSGGKLKDGETIEECMIRELEEETNLKTTKEDLDFAGILYFYFPDNPEWDNECHLFRIKDFDGKAKESEEMRPEWFSLDEIPYEKMWKDDPIWLPRIIDGEYIEYKLYFDKNGGVEKFIKLK